MRYKVLVVDDDKANLKLFSAMLTRMGHFVIVAENGVEAVNLFNDNEFNMILMDFQMPVMNGLEATFKIREVEKKRNSGLRTPIIAVSGSLNKEAKASFLKAGVDDFITKPIEKEIFINTILKNI